MSKKLTAILVAMVMLSTIMVGCGQSAQPQASSTVVAQASSSVAAPAGNGGSKDPVKIVHYFKPVTDGNEQSDPEAMKTIHDLILNDTGADIEILYGSKNDDDHTTKLNLLLSSNQQVDIFEESWQPLYVKGFLADLTDVIAAEPTAQEALAQFKDETIAGVKVNGRMMAFPYNDAGSTYPVWLRQDLLDKCGLQKPKTIDELENVLKVFKEKDPIGGGKTMGLVTSAEGLRKAFMGGFTENGDGRFMSADGNITPYFLNPGYKNFVQKMANWYKAGLIAPETFSYNRTNIVEFIRKGQVASFAEWYSMVTLSYKQFKDAFPEGEYTYIDGLTGEKGLCESIWPVIKPSVNERAAGVMCVNARTADIPTAVKVLAWGYLNNSQNFLTAFQGVENIGWKWVDKSTKTYELIKDPSQKYLGEYNMYMSLVNELNVNSLDPERLFHNKWLKEGWFRYDKAKWSADKTTMYDNQALKDNIPNYVEIMNVVQEEMIKFIIGSRPMSDWDNYTKTLESMSTNKMVAEFTRQYKELSK